MPQAAVGTRVIFDDEQVEVWHFTLGASEEIDHGGALRVRRGTRATASHEGVVELKAQR
jgi:hypothetical protein